MIYYIAVINNLFKTKYVMYLFYAILQLFFIKKMLTRYINNYIIFIVTMCNKTRRYIGLSQFTGKFYQSRNMVLVYVGYNTKT